MELKSFLAEKKTLIEEFLKEALSEKPLANNLWKAMAYSCLNGGKRLRGILCLSVFEALKPNPNNWKKALPIAAGLECIHSMSLIHDDLPCMDNDNLRRGKPTCHIAFDEATALLAGDALLIEGLGLCLQADLPPKILLTINQEIIKSIGASGMTGGQMLDLNYTNLEIKELEILENIHKLKTGVFLKASIMSGALAAEANELELKAFEKYALNIGLAFQIIDDLLDLESDSVTLGKTAGKDLAQNKNTYPKLLGINQSKLKAQELIVEAKKALLEINISFPPLHQIADYIISRNY